MWLLCNRVHTFQIKPCNLYPVGIKYMQLYLLGLIQTNIIFLFYSQLVSIVITEWVHDRNSYVVRQQASVEKPQQAKEAKIMPVMLCAHGSYKGIFEACFVDLECLEKHNLLTALLENIRNHHGIACFSINLHKASPLGLIS